MLRPVQISKIPKLRKDGYTVEVMAKMFDVEPQEIRNAIATEAWSDYLDEPGKPDRCPDCGGQVQDDTKPCMYCAVTRSKKGE